MCSLIFLLFFTSPCRRRIAYEVFLRGHQATAALSACGLSMHLWRKTRFCTYSLLAAGGVLGCSTALDLLPALFRNYSFYRGFPRAQVKACGRGIKIDIVLPHRIDVKAGQYINIWLPRASFRSIFQSHPFMVTSWRRPDTGPMRIQLLIEPREGFTRRLRRLCNSDKKCILLFGGSYGTPQSLGQYGSVLLVATGAGIAALLPYLKGLLVGYLRCEVVTRRIHLVWQMVEKG